MIWTAVLGLGFIFALAGDFVLWAKLDEQKQKTADEHANYIAALNIGNVNAERAQLLEQHCIDLNEIACKQFEHGVFLYEKNGVLQDRLSALLCNHNDHVWKDGVCVKCGRTQEDD